MDPAIKDEIANTVKGVCGTFTKEYVKHYAISLAKVLEAESKEDNPLKLLRREKPTDDLKSGYLTKEGGVRKNWKKRWFIVRHDYSVDYFVDEKAATKAKPKPKGSMSLAGYHVRENIGEGLMKQAKDLAEKMGIDVGQLPKPKEYPELCFELHHSRRRCYFVECATKEEKNEWVEMFKTCCRNAWGLKKHDKVHQKAFHRAVRETRWSLGRWGWWSYGGSEEQILSDIINDEIEYQTIGKVYAKLSGPWIIRNTVRNSALKVIDSMVSAAVNPAWAAMSKTTDEIRPKLEPVIKGLIDPMSVAKEEIRGKIKDAIMSVLEPLIDKHVNPHLSKIMDILKSPVKSSYDEAWSIVQTNVKQYGETADLKEPSGGFKKLDWVARSYWTMQPATSKLDVMYEPLWLLREIFTDIFPWSLIWNSQDEIRQISDDAIYTFQVRLKEAIEKEPGADKAVIDQTLSQVQALYEEDSNYLAMKVWRTILKAIIMPPLEAIANPAVKALLDPLDSAIPDAMKEFISIADEFSILLNDIVDSSVDAVLK